MPHDKDKNTREQESFMIVIRNVFQCKPGKAKDLVTMLKASGEAMQSNQAVKGTRVLTDAAATFWTVVLEIEYASLDGWQKSVQEFGSDQKAQKAMEGYMDLVTGGHREIWKVE
jgi:hypothetical protein